MSGTSICQEERAVNPEAKRRKFKGREGFQSLEGQAIGRQTCEGRKKREGGGARACNAGLRFMGLEFLLYFNQRQKKNCFDKQLIIA